MKKLILISVDSKKEGLPEAFIGLAPQIRELFTGETHLMVNVVSSCNQNSTLRQIVQSLKSQNFHFETLETRFLGSKEKFMEEIQKSIAEFSFTLGLTDYLPGDLYNIFSDLCLREKMEKIPGPGGLDYFLAEF